MRYLDTSAFGFDDIDVVVSSADWIESRQKGDNEEQLDMQ